MAGKTGEEGHIRPERGTDVLDRAEPDVQEPDVKAGPEADAEADAKADVKPGVDPDAKPGVDADVKPGVEPDVKADEEAGPEPVVEADRQVTGLGESVGDASIFVDPSGRRASRMRRMGWLVTVGCVCSAATLGLVVTDAKSDAPWLQIPGVIGSDDRNRDAEVAQRPKGTESGTPAADSLPDTVATPPGGQTTGSTAGTTGAEAMSGSRPDGDGTDPSPTGRSTTGASSGASGTPAGSGAGTEEVAEQPGRTSPSDTAEAPTADPSPAESTPPDTSAEPDPAETPSDGLLGGRADAVAGLFG